MPEEQMMHRSFSIRADKKPKIDTENRTIEVSFSSEEPYVRQDWYGEKWSEVLSHDADDVDLSRLNNGAPVLYNHDRWDKENRIGIVEKAWIEKGKGRALIRISKRDDVEGVWRDIEDGILVNVSVGYQITEKTLVAEHVDTPNEYRVKWAPHEVSLVDIPADPTVGVGRSHGEPINDLVSAIKSLVGGDTDNRNQGDTVAANNVTEKNQPMEKDMPQEIDEKAVKLAETRGKELARKEEQVRRDSVAAVFVGDFAVKFRDLKEKCLGDMECTEDQARAKLLDELSRDVEPTAADVRVVVQEDERDKFAKGALSFIDVRMGNAKDNDAGNEFRGYSYIELCRAALTKSGVSHNGLQKQSIISRAMTTSDLPNIFRDASNKTLQRAYSELPQTFRALGRQGSMPDFKSKNVAALSAAPNLIKKNQAGEFEHGVVTDKNESYALATYGRQIRFTREMMINDDLDALSRMLTLMGSAAARLESDLVWNHILANPTMADGVALFHADHGNLGSAAAISTAAISLSRARMRKQTGLAGEAIEVFPAFLVCGPDKETEAEMFLSGTMRPTKTADVVPERLRNSLDLVVENRVSGNKWFVFASPSLIDTFEYSFLEGSQGVYTEEQVEFLSGDLTMGVRHDFAAKAIDHRGMDYNPGA